MAFIPRLLLRSSNSAPVPAAHFASAEGSGSPGSNRIQSNSSGATNISTAPDC
jgi:hypothetical protein